MGHGEAAVRAFVRIDRAECMFAIYGLLSASRRGDIWVEYRRMALSIDFARYFYF